MEFTGYIVGTCDGIEVNKPIHIEVDDLAVTIEAGHVNLTSLDPKHTQLLTYLIQQMLRATSARRASTLSDVGTTLASGLLASLLLMVGL